MKELARQYVDAWGRFREASFFGESCLVIMATAATLAAGIIALIVSGVLYGRPQKAQRMALCRNVAFLKVLAIPIAMLFPALLYPVYGSWEAPKIVFQHPSEGLLTYEGPLRGFYVVGASHAYVVHSEFAMFVPKETLVRRLVLHPMPLLLLCFIGIIVIKAAAWVWSMPRDLLAAYLSFRAPLREPLEILSRMGEREVSIPGLCRFAFSLRPARLQEEVLRRIEKEVERAKRIRGEVAVSVRAQDVERKRAQYDATLRELAGKFARGSREFRQASAALAPEASFAKKREAISALAQALSGREKERVARKRTPPPPKPSEPAPPLRLVPQPSRPNPAVRGEYKVFKVADVEEDFHGEQFFPEGVDKAMGRAILLELIDPGCRKARFEMSHRERVSMRDQVANRYRNRGQYFDPKIYAKTLKWLVSERILLEKRRKAFSKVIPSLSNHPGRAKSEAAAAVIRENIRFFQSLANPGAQRQVAR